MMRKAALARLRRNLEQLCSRPPPGLGPPDDEILRLQRELLAVEAMARAAIYHATDGLRSEGTHALDSARCVKGGEAEQQAHDEYLQWCQNGEQETGFDMETATKEKEMEGILAQLPADMDAGSEDMAANSTGSGWAKCDPPGALHFKRQRGSERTTWATSKEWWR